MDVKKVQRKSDGKFFKVLEMTADDIRVEDKTKTMWCARFDQYGDNRFNYY